MAEELCKGLYPVAVSEFFQDGAVTINGACGPNAVYHALCVRDGQPATEAGFQAFMRSMRSAGLCSETGITTMANMVEELQRLDVPLLATLPWNGSDQSGAVQRLLDAHAGFQPVLYQTSRGQVLRDYLTGTGERATNLQEHFICVVGQNTGGPSALAKRDLPAGYWCADGCAFAVGWGTVGPLVFYPVMTLAATHPIAAAVVALKPAAPLPPPPPPTPDPARVLAEIKNLVAPW